MGDRPTQALGGVGRQTAEKLAALGIDTVNQLAESDVLVLAAELGPTMGPWYHRLGRGMDTSPVDATPYVPRAHGRETTFQTDLEDWAQIAEEVRMAEEAFGVKPIFLGKTSVFSAGVTIMSGFPPERRYLAKNTTLLIHERRTTKDVHITGQIGASIQVARELVAELEAGLRVQNEGFARLVEGTDVSYEEVLQKASTGWYVSAQEALDRRLVAGIL